MYGLGLWYRKGVKYKLFFFLTLLRYLEVSVSLGLSF